MVRFGDLTLLKLSIYILVYLCLGINGNGNGRARWYKSLGSFSQVDHVVESKEALSESECLCRCQVSTDCNSFTLRTTLDGLLLCDVNVGMNFSNINAETGAKFYGKSAGFSSVVFK